MLRFSAGRATVAVDLEHGGRIGSLRLGDRELLVTSAPSPIDWGWYPMAPWAGRTRRGRFELGGLEYRLPLHSDGHALHGTVYTRPWQADGPSGWSTDLGPDWPFIGRVRQTIALSADALELEMELTSGGDEFPAAIGWHPWFARVVESAEARLDLPASFMLARDAEGIAGARRVPVPDGPWDDCFGGLVAPVILEWPGVERLVIETDCPYVVVFNERENGWCVEPQTGPPDALNQDRIMVAPGAPLRAWMRVTWGAEAPPGGTPA